MAAKIRIQKVDGEAERLMCIGLIASDKVIKQLAPIMSPDILESKCAQSLAAWSLDYFKEFGAAPKLHIQDIFESKKRNFLDDDVADLIERMLVSINEQMHDQTDLNEDYIIVECEKLIKSRKAKMLAEDITAYLSKGQVLEAEGLIAEYNIPKRPGAEGIDIFNLGFFQEDDIRNSRLFRLKGELHSIVGWIERDSFIGILAPEKIGKTWVCMQFSLDAFRAGCNVCFFAIGDMTRPQMRRRFRHMLTGRDPRRTDDSKILVPVLDCKHNQMDSCPIGNETDSILIGKGDLATPGVFEDFPSHTICVKCYKNERDKRHFCGVPWYRETTAKAEQKPLDEALKNIKKRAPDKNFRLFCFPPNSVSVAMIRNELDILHQQEGFLPDVIIIDYADNLLAEQGTARLDYRNQINVTWQALRKLSQELNCALFAATQAKAAARTKAQIGQDDVSEDKRKLAHVTAMLALNKSTEDKRRQIMRVTNIASRDVEFDVEKNVAILQCLATGRPILHAYVLKEVSDGLAKKKHKKHPD